MTVDYRQIIDAETWAFIERTESFYPPLAVSLSVAEQRSLYDRMSAAFRAPRPDGVTVTDRHIGPVPVRDYRARDARTQVLFFHGGGFVLGGLDSHDDVCAEICDQTGFNVTAVDYRLAPEHRFPSDLEDALTVWDDLCVRESDQIVLVGDSAGGTICAGLSHVLRPQARRPDGQVLIYPGLGFAPGTRSMEVHAAAPMLSRDDCLYFHDLRIGGNTDLSADPRCCPLQAETFTNLPATLVFAAECDPLADEGAAYVNAIVKDCGTARFVLETGLVHGYLRARHSITRARESFARIVSAIADLGAGRSDP